MSSEDRRAAIDVIVEKCDDECPFHRANNCADDGIDFWCEANDHVDLDKHFEPRSLPFSRIVIPDFPKNCPLEKVIGEAPVSEPTTRMTEAGLKFLEDTLADIAGEASQDYNRSKKSGREGPNSQFLEGRVTALSEAVRLLRSAKAMK